MFDYISRPRFESGRAAAGPAAVRARRCTRPAFRLVFSLQSPHDTCPVSSMKLLPILLACFSFACSGRGAVRVFIQSTNGLANINYQCTGGEVVRSFALDVTVDRGQILAVTNFFRGPGTPAARGYGIFPASFRDNITVFSGTNANWATNSYSPLAVPGDNRWHSAGPELERGYPGIRVPLGPRRSRRRSALHRDALLPANKSDGQHHLGVQRNPRRNHWRAARASYHA